MPEQTVTAPYTDTPEHREMVVRVGTGHVTAKGAMARLVAQGHDLTDRAALDYTAAELRHRSRQYGQSSDTIGSLRHRVTALEVDRRGWIKHALAASKAEAAKDPERERRRDALVAAVRSYVAAGRELGLPIAGTKTRALVEALHDLDEYGPAEIVAPEPAHWATTAASDAAAARIARYEETSCLGRDRAAVLADFPDGVAGAVRLARADVAARAPGWRTVRALLLALEDAQAEDEPEQDGPADRAEIGEVLRNATDALADLVHNSDDPGTAALGALFEARQTVSRLRPDPAITRTWTAGAVDPADWLRGATSSGDPLWPAVRSVLAELATLRAAVVAADL